MKIAISIPDDVFQAGDHTARALGLSRSQLYTRAVSEFEARHERASITERLDAVHGDGESASGLDDTLAALQSLSVLAHDRW